MTIGWHRSARHCSVENMLIWWYHTLNWFISHSVCKYFCPAHTRASRCDPPEAWIRSLRWPAAKGHSLQWRTAAVERKSWTNWTIRSGRKHRGQQTIDISASPFFWTYTYKLSNHDAEKLYKWFKDTLLHNCGSLCSVFQLLLAIYL